jgi:hypothetical protein
MLLVWNNTGSTRFTVTGFSASGNYTINVTSPASLPIPTGPTGDVRTAPTNLVEELIPLLCE